MIDRHKVFISYYHHDDQYYKDEIESWNDIYHLFVDFSVNDGDIDDANMSDEAIRMKIRDEYIKDSTVLILLCGPNTKHRKFIDWELHAAMYNTEKNPKMGILVVNLPLSKNNIRAVEDREKQIVAPYTTWTSFKTRTEYEESYPDIPSRIIDSLVTKNSDITFVNWDTISKKPYLLQELVDFAYKRRKTVEYDLSAPLRRKNTN
ncbi:MAG: TIR domain-containing protein [Bacilli bacterium]|nr:TIR domain-containing protein [Bacilli bacterium]